MKTQRGSARFGYFLIMLGLLIGTVPSITAMQGCTQARSAYKTADNPAELAYVLTEHYAALVKAAADLAQKPTTPASAIVAMQKADAVAKPVVLRLRPLREAYVTGKTAANEAELQAAIDRGVLALADLVRAINVARGVK